MVRRCIGMFALLGLFMPSAGWGKSDADILSENMPAIQLWSDTKLGATYRPYFCCFAQTVGSGRGSKLQTDADVLETVIQAQTSCAEQKGRSTALADHYLATIKPTLSEEERAGLLARYRRQMGLFAVAEWYRSNGRSAQFKRYLERTGRSGKHGHVPVLLSAE